MVLGGLFRKKYRETPGKYIVWALLATILMQLSACRPEKKKQEDPCVSGLVVFANKFDITTEESFNASIALGKQFGIGYCNFKAHRDEFSYKKAICLIILKWTAYFKKTEPDYHLDLLPIISNSSATKKIVYEFFYLARKDVFPGYPYVEIQIFSPEEVLPYINNDSELSQDPELKKWIKLQGEIPYDPKPWAL